jgi:DNA-binding beta-propeller fold protein YncE
MHLERAHLLHASLGCFVALGAACTAAPKDPAAGHADAVTTADADGGDDDGGAPGSPDATAAPDGAVPLDGAVLYVASDDGTIDAYQEGTWQPVGHWSGLPFSDGVRGVDVDPVSGTLFVSHGPTSEDPGALLAWSLTSSTTTYDVRYPHGIDQPSFDNGVLYMPCGEASRTVSETYLIDPTTGTEIGSEVSSLRAHNLVARNGHRYSGGMGDTQLVVLGIGAGFIGPSPSPKYGVRPFTVNAAETRAWVTWSGYRGFSVGDIGSGAVLDSVDFGALPAGLSPYTGVSHGISLSPDESELYVVDEVMNQVRVYDASDAPALLATIDLAHPIYPGTEPLCPGSCEKSGWLLHSRDGRFVMVGDSGDVIDTGSRQIVANIPPMQGNRHGFIEVDWTQGVVSGTTTHFGLGYGR